MSDSGSLDASVTGTSLSLSVVIGTDSSGHATLSSTGCSLSVGDISVTFHGGARLVVFCLFVFLIHFLISFNSPLCYVL